jgi:flagellar basal body-associated protein FliL
MSQSPSPRGPWPIQSSQSGTDLQYQQWQQTQQPYPPPQQQWQQSPMPTQQQWQQPPLQSFPPQYQQPQQWGQFPPQPSKKKSRKGLWIALSIILSIVIIAVAVGSHGGSQPSTSSSSSNQQQSTQAANQPTSPPTSQPAANTIGKPVVVDSTWTVTVNSVKTSQGDQITAPKSGDIYVIVDVTLKNTSSTNQPVSSLVQFNFKDSTGQQYTETVTDFTHPPDGMLTAGGVLRGQLAYEVPSSQHDFILQFQPDITSTNVAEWTLKV